MLVVRGVRTAVGQAAFLDWGWLSDKVGREAIIRDRKDVDIHA